MVCATRTDASTDATTLAGIAASDDVLATYWREFTGDGELEAGAAMREALDWLRQVLTAGREADWVVILAG
ncbi:hypothetical protein FRUB_06686 [Fimbriiglobus ruber]|uniref:Uncharacterized protein n=1 Tax=Fimbriiglobus ruber TaxID=1908690 RepID=A0A225DJF7_9BACT|nr:hypothetical protein FRUB_06686 [Fimbriiglobus ruber]